MKENKEKTKQEPCPWCKAEYTIIDDDFGQPIHPNMIKFCFYCGRPWQEGEPLLGVGK